MSVLAGIGQDAFGSYAKGQADGYATGTADAYAKGYDDGKASGTVKE